jgi:hypothetical protein
MMRAVPHMSLYLQDVSLNSWLILQCTVCGIKRSYSERSVWRTIIYFVFSAQNARNNARWGFEVMTALTILMLVFYIVTSYGLALKMEAVCSSETLISTYIFTRCHNPEDQHGHTIKKSCLLVCRYLSYLKLLNSSQLNLALAVYVKMCGVRMILFHVRPM